MSLSINISSLVLAATLAVGSAAAAKSLPPTDNANAGQSAQAAQTRSPRERVARRVDVNDDGRLGPRERARLRQIAGEVRGKVRQHRLDRFDGHSRGSQDPQTWREGRRPVRFRAEAGDLRQRGQQRDVSSTRKNRTLERPQAPGRPAPRASDDRRGPRREFIERAIRERMRLNNPSPEGARPRLERRERIPQ